MEHLVKEVEFEKLRLAYVIVKEFLEERSMEKVDSLRTTIAEDLWLMGDDNYFMLTEFVEKYKLDFSKFEYEKHFHSEGELTVDVGSLINFLKFSVRLPLLIIEKLSLNNLELKKPEYSAPDRPIDDMTFKDLITCYIEGEYKTNENVRYKLKINY